MQILDRVTATDFCLFGWLVHWCFRNQLSCRHLGFTQLFLISSFSLESWQFGKLFHVADTINSLELYVLRRCLCLSRSTLVPLSLYKLATAILQVLKSTLPY